MSENQTPEQNHDDDTDGHRFLPAEGAPGFRAAEGAPGFRAALGEEPGFVVDVPNQQDGDDTEGHHFRPAEEPGFAALDHEQGFAARETAPGAEEDDTEGHLSGARHVDPDVPSAAGDLKAVHPKGTEDRFAF